MHIRSSKYNTRKILLHILSHSIYNFLLALKKLTTQNRNKHIYALLCFALFKKKKKKQLKKIIERISDIFHSILIYKQLLRSIFYFFFFYFCSHGLENVNLIYFTLFFFQTKKTKFSKFFFYVFF